MAIQDNITPILPEDYRREIGPKVWHWEQVYFGPEPSKYDDASILQRYVPVERDIIMHPDTGDWVVGTVSEQYIPTLKPRQVNSTNNDIDDTIVVPSKSYNRRADVLHVDTTVHPIRFYVNSRIWIHGSQASHYKIYSGIDIGLNGNSIGAVYNPAGVITSDHIELELAAFDRDNITNVSIRTPRTGNLRELPLNDDIVTLVVYAQDGSLLDTQVLVVSHENFIPSHTSTRFISDIRLDSPYISQSDASVIEIKRNMLVQSLAMFGVATYNDGSNSQRLPVGGSKFKLHGLEAFTASTDLQEVDVTLVYLLGADEAGANTTGTQERAIAKTYTIKTIPSDAAYSVKLFVIPVWNANTARYDLKYKLYDLRRDSVRDVTDLVETSQNFRFNPAVYGTKQTIQVAINLMNVGPQYQFYRPVQTFDITLIRPATSANAPSYYLLSYSADAVVGTNLAANLVNGNSFNLSGGNATIDAWISNVYNKLGVIYTGDTSAPPIPTKFRVKNAKNTAVFEFPIARLVEAVNIQGNWVQGDTLILEFFAESSGELLELASMAMNVNVVN